MAKILLVEDDTNLSEIYQARMEAEGYTVIAAADGESALAIAAKEKPDLILSDVMMPKISGFEMLDILRNTNGLKDTKVIMLTALGQAEDRGRAEALGADRYLVKSQVTLEDIVSAAQELLGEKELPSSAELAAPTVTAAEPTTISTEPVQPAPAEPLPATTPAAVVNAVPVADVPVAEPAAVAEAPLVAAEPVATVPTANPVDPVTVATDDLTAAIDNSVAAAAIAAPVDAPEPVVAEAPAAVEEPVEAPAPAPTPEVAETAPEPAVEEVSPEEPVAEAGEEAGPVEAPAEPEAPAEEPTTEIAPLAELWTDEQGPAVHESDANSEDAPVDAATPAPEVPAEPETPSIPEVPAETAPTPEVAETAPEPAVEAPTPVAIEAPALVAVPIPGPAPITSPEIPAPVPTPALEKEQLQVATMPVHDPNSPMQPAPVSEAPAPAPVAPVAPAEPVEAAPTAAAIDEKVVANAVDKLLAKSPSEQIDAAITPGASDGRHVKKIIAPLSHPDEPSLQELLAKEEAMEVGSNIAPVPVPDVTAEIAKNADAALSNDEAEAAALLAKAQATAGTPGQTPATDKQAFDPNSISL